MDVAQPPKPRPRSEWGTLAVQPLAICGVSCVAGAEVPPARVVFAQRALGLAAAALRSLDHDLEARTRTFRGERASAAPALPPGSPSWLLPGLRGLHRAVLVRAACASLARVARVAMFRHCARLAHESVA